MVWTKQVAEPPVARGRREAGMADSEPCRAAGGGGSGGEGEKGGGGDSPGGRPEMYARQRVRKAPAKADGGPRPSTGRELRRRREGGEIQGGEGRFAVGQGGEEEGGA